MAKWIVLSVIIIVPALWIAWLMGEDEDCESYVRYPDPNEAGWFIERVQKTSWGADNIYNWGVEGISSTPEERNKMDLCGICKDQNRGFYAEPIILGMQPGRNPLREGYSFDDCRCHNCPNDIRYWKAFLRENNEKLKRYASYLKNREQEKELARIEAEKLKQKAKEQERERQIQIVIEGIRRERGEKNNSNYSGYVPLACSSGQIDVCDWPEGCIAHPKGIYRPHSPPIMSDTMHDYNRETGQWEN